MPACHDPLNYRSLSPTYDSRYGLHQSNPVAHAYDALHYLTAVIQTPVLPEWAIHENRIAMADRHGHKHFVVGSLAVCIPLFIPPGLDGHPSSRFFECATCIPYLQWDLC
jgi:hypothetical protein